MVRLAALAILTATLIGCATSQDDCNPNCGIIKAKKAQWSHIGGQRYVYTIDNECSGQRYNLSGQSSIQYNDLLIGDRLCSSDVW
jgi:hypothetical protein